MNMQVNTVLTTSGSFPTTLVGNCTNSVTTTTENVSNYTVYTCYICPTCSCWVPYNTQHNCGIPGFTWVPNIPYQALPVQTPEKLEPVKEKKRRKKSRKSDYLTDESPRRAISLNDEV